MGSGEKTGREEKDMSGKNHVVGLGREKQVRQPKPETNRQVTERKLGVRSGMRAEKPTMW
jgi:hypothetical protein